jgi:hypothetical protein
MALLKKAAAVAEPFVVPSLADVDDTYGILVAKRAELHAKLSDAAAANRMAEQELASDTSKEVSLAVSELLGDGPSAKTLKRRALADARQAVTDIEAALVEVDHRIRDAKPAALRAAIARIRPEWQKRTTALCNALAVAQAAHVELDSLRRDMEAEDVSSDHVGPRPYFLGDAKDGRIAAYFRETGYAG